MSAKETIHQQRSVIRRQTKQIRLLKRQLEIYRDIADEFESLTDKQSKTLTSLHLGSFSNN